MATGEAIPHLAREPTPAGWALHQFFTDGSPRGIRRIWKDNWSGVVYEFGQSDLGRACSFDELAGSGVYLFIEDGADREGLPRIYVGEGDSVAARLPDSRKERGWWNRALAFTAVDGSITKAHAMHIEARLCAIATHFKRCVLDNGTSPKSNLRGHDEVMAEGYLAEMLAILPALGVDAFEPVDRDAALKSPELTLRGKGIEAVGLETSQGFLVEEGSSGVSDGNVRTSLSEGNRRLRRELLDKGVLVTDGGNLRLVQDYIFDSPSAAAAVLLGNSVNGREAWKDKDGKTLKEIQESDASEVQRLPLS